MKHSIKKQIRFWTCQMHWFSKALPWLGKLNFMNYQILFDMDKVW